MTRATAIALLTLCAALAGCGGGGGGVLPPEPEQPDAAPASDTEGQPAPAPDGVTVPSGGGGSSAEQVASDYARAFTNWTWRDVATKTSGVLARLAAGRLRDSVRANAVALREDTTLERDQRANHGVQLAIDVQDADAATRSVWIVMRETASMNGSKGLSDTKVRVYEVTVRRLENRRWYTIGFEPQG